MSSDGLKLYSLNNRSYWLASALLAFDVVDGDVFINLFSQLLSSKLNEAHKSFDGDAYCTVGTRMEEFSDSPIIPEHSFGRLNFLFDLNKARDKTQVI